MKEMHPYLRPVDLDSSFKLKNDHDEVIVEILSLGALKTAIEGVPDTSLFFHLDGRNDFSRWIHDVVGFKALSKEIGKIKINDRHPEETRKQMVRLLDFTLEMLKEV